MAFCFTCITKSLPLEQRLCLLLKEVYDFKVKETSTITGNNKIPPPYHAAKMIDIFEGRCALINKAGMCHQCSEIDGIFDPKQNTQEEIVKIKMVREAEKMDKQKLFNLRMEVVMGIDPFAAGAHELQVHHLAVNRKVMEEYLEKEE